MPMVASLEISFHVTLNVQCRSRSSVFFLSFLFFLVCMFVFLLTWFALLACLLFLLFFFRFTFGFLFFLSFLVSVG